MRIENCLENFVKLSTIPRISFLLFSNNFLREHVHRYNEKTVSFIIQIIYYILRNHLPRTVAINKKMHQLDDGLNSRL